MSAVCGIDLSTKAIDLVKLDETENWAEWRRVALTGGDAWARILTVRDTLPIAGWDDVYLVAIETPFGSGTGPVASLNRVVGAIAASLPARLRTPERCWIVRPDEWKRGLGLTRKPDDEWWAKNVPEPWPQTPYRPRHWPQDARDAYCMALWARETLAKASAA